MKKKETLLKTNNSTESDEYKKLIILVAIIASVFILFFILTTLFTKKNHDNIFENKLDASEIQYKEIIIGSMFDKDGEYYVLLIEKDDVYKDLFDTYISKIKDDKLYTVDLSNAFNKKYLSDDYSYDDDEFKVKGTTLVKIDDHKIVQHFETKEGIIEKLKTLED